MTVLVYIVCWLIFIIVNLIITAVAGPQIIPLVTLSGVMALLSVITVQDLNAKATKLWEQRSVAETNSDAWRQRFNEKQEKLVEERRNCSEKVTRAVALFADVRKNMLADHHGRFLLMHEAMDDSELGNEALTYWCHFRDEWNAETEQMTDNL